jgi:hypothetical protein
MNISAGCDDIENYVYEDFPLGQFDAERIAEKKVFDILFRRNSELQRCSASRPSIILGRRGSGKTAVLRDIMYSTKYDVIININASEAFSQVANAVCIAQRAAPVDMESISELWDLYFFSHIVADLPSSMDKETIGKPVLNHILGRDEWNVVMATDGR